MIIGKLLYACFRSRNVVTGRAEHGLSALGLGDAGSTHNNTYMPCRVQPHAFRGRLGILHDGAR